MTESIVKKSRALGLALTPKAVTYFERRPFPPGQHGKSRKQNSDYKVRLTEKQRLRAQYDISEKQMARAFEAAKKADGKTGDALVTDLETRLDAMVMRSGLARTVQQARQMVVHGHIQVNGSKVDRPSFRMTPGDVVTVREKSRTTKLFRTSAEGGNVGFDTAPKYIEVNLKALAFRLDRAPQRREVPVICDEQLVVEYYSR